MCLVCLSVFLLFLAVEPTEVYAGSGDGHDLDRLKIILPIVGGVVLVAIIGIALLIFFYWRRKKKRVTLSSSDDMNDGDQRSLVSHDYDSVYSSRRSSRSSTIYSTLKNSSPPPETSTGYTTVNHSNQQPNYTSSSECESFSRGIKTTHTSYGAVDGDIPSPEVQYSYVPVDRGRGRPISSATAPQNWTKQDDLIASVGKNEESAYNSMVYTTRHEFVYQSLKHTRSGTYVPTEEERGAVGAHYETTEIGAYNKLDFFDISKTYWPPALTTSGLYAQLSSNRYREIPRQQILILEQIGSGQFGTVSKGMWTCEGESMLVAVKSLRSDASESEKIKFLQEAALMGQFSHPYVIKIFGVVTVTMPSLIVLELATTDLRKYLQTIRLGEQYKEYLPNQFLKFGWEIAGGMEYFGKKCFVHRDLAARNILLDSMLTCKIGDFGMAIDLMDEAYYTSTENRPIPVKWMAPEALMYRTYSTASDVWSFGMVLYEIWSVGLKPYHDLTNKEVIEQLQDRLCQTPPPGCPRAVYKLMVDCWNPEPKERPSFSQVYRYLHQPEDYLLCWSDEDMSVSAGASQLGADHTESQQLYLDLQTKYSSDYSSDC